MKWSMQICLPLKIFTLKNQPKWQQECELGPPPDPTILTLGKEREREGFDQLCDIALCAV